MKTVMVLMSTYNGEKYLEQQINSILAQKSVKLKILIRDDGSSDNTINILKKYQDNKKIKCYFKENIGYGKSFLELSRQASIADYYAFCDQDDIWGEEKLLRAIDKLQNSSPEVPSLYFSALTYVDENSTPIGVKEFKDMEITLASALIRHRAAGCTMVFNRKLVEYSNQCDFSNYNNVIHHDAWMYRLCLSLDGDVYYDNTSYILYRQHSNNVTGFKQGLKKRINREINKYRLYKNTKLSIVSLILSEYNNNISKENKKILQDISNYKKNLWNLISLLKNKQFRSHNLIFDTIMWIEVSLRYF